MNDLTLMRTNLFRKTLRTILMLVAILIAFFIFGVLASFNKAFNAGADLSAANRLITVNKINFTVSLPYAYINKVRALEGVETASWANWFGGFYQENRNFVQTFAVDPETYLAVYPELITPEEQKQDFFSDRSTILIGEALANQYGWSVGDTIPLKSDIFSHKSGQEAWEFRIAGVFTGETPQTPTNYALFHWENFNETITFGQDAIGFIILTTTSADLNEQVSEAIDVQFANSTAETETTTEAAFNKAFLNQVGNIGLIINSVVGAAFATILMIVGTTMVLAVRERTKEIAVMKTLGFPAPRIFRLVLGESLLLAFLGGALGLGAAWLLISAIGGALESFVPGFALSPEIALQGAAIMALLGLVTGFAPAWSAMRVNIAEALGKG